MARTARQLLSFLLFSYHRVEEAGLVHLEKARIQASDHPFASPQLGSQLEEKREQLQPLAPKFAQQRVKEAKCAVTFEDTGV